MRDGGSRPNKQQPEKKGRRRAGALPACNPIAKETTMPRISTDQADQACSHRTYVDKRGGTFIPCRAVTDDELLTMAEQADRIELRQAGTNKMTTSDLSAVLASLTALAWKEGRITNPAALRRAIHRKIGDQRARLRLKWGRTLLAGAVASTDAGQDERILLIVLVGRGISSCDWQLAF
jgi:hypothetical protein